MTTAQKTFLEYDRIKELSEAEHVSESVLDEILDKGLKLQGLSTFEASRLLAVNERRQLEKILDAARIVKQKIYGSRIVLFAPLYAGNKCSNNCLYCGFRTGNRYIKRITLNMDQITHETEMLLRQGHKRVLLLTGESEEYPVDYITDSVAAVYRAEYRGSAIRRVNLEVAPLEIEDFRLIKKTGIGTYTCFQETYDPDIYSECHPSGKKADYHWRLYAMDRAMEAGIDDVGIGALFGLGSYKFEVISLLMHAAHLERKYGCGPHTVSIPRVEPASGAPLSVNVPNPVTDDDFRKIAAVIRISLPYTGIILSTREPAELRNEMFNYGVSQVSGGSKTNPGGYSDTGSCHSSPENTPGQFALGDNRTLEEIISSLIDSRYIPSFCTGCYRRGRTGSDFMELAKPGLIRQYCMPNGIVSFAEYLCDYAGVKTREKGFRLIREMIRNTENSRIRNTIEESVKKVTEGERDIYL